LEPSKKMLCYNPIVLDDAGGLLAFSLERESRERVLRGDVQRVWSEIRQQFRMRDVMCVSWCLYAQAIERGDFLDEVSVELAWGIEVHQIR
jgi:hypothetical protein